MTTAKRAAQALMPETCADIAAKTSRLLADAMKRDASMGHFSMADELGVAKAFFDLSAKMLCDPFKLAEAQNTLAQTTAARYAAAPWTRRLLYEPGAIVHKTICSMNTVVPGRRHSRDRAWLPRVNRRGRLPVVCAASCGIWMRHFRSDDHSGPPMLGVWEG